VYRRAAWAALELGFAADLPVSPPNAAAGFTLPTLVSEPFSVAIS
jgi:hypothetical protein